MDSQMVDVRDRQLDLFDESVYKLYLVTDAVLTLQERGLLTRSVLKGDTVHLEIDLPAQVFINALKDYDICVDVEEPTAAAGAGKPIFFHWLYNKLRFKIFRHETKKK